MIYFYLWILIFCSGENEVCARFSDWMKPIKNEINRFKFYQVSAFANNVSDSNTGRLMDFLIGITSKIPVLVVNCNRSMEKNAEDNGLVKIGSLSRSSALNIIILPNEEDQLENVYDILNFIANASRIYPRPKCLVLLFSKNIALTESLKNILFYTWTVKFTDFTILNIGITDDFEFYYYNPFNSTYVTSKTNVFPDKLQNMNNYTLKLPVYDLLRVIIKQRNNLFRNKT